MPAHISVADLQSAVDKAVANIKFVNGPLIIGFVAPDTISREKANQLAEEVTRLSGIAGKAIVSDLAAGSAATVGIGERELVAGQHHIIIGLIAQDR